MSEQPKSPQSNDNKPIQRVRRATSNNNNKHSNSKESSSPKDNNKPKRSRRPKTNQRDARGKSPNNSKPKENRSQKNRPTQRKRAAGKKSTGQHNSQKKQNSQQKNPRRSHHQNDEQETAPKLTLLQKILQFFGVAPTVKPPLHAPTPRQKEIQRRTRSEAKRQAEIEAGDRPEAITPKRATKKKLFVGNLANEVTEEDLKDLFKGIGPVRSTEIIYDKSTYQSKGFGFVTMNTTEEAQSAVDILHDQFFMGKKLTITEARDKQITSSAAPENANPSS